MLLHVNSVTNEKTVNITTIKIKYHNHRNMIQLHVEPPSGCIYKLQKPELYRTICILINKLKCKFLQSSSYVLCLLTAY